MAKNYIKNPKERLLNPKRKTISFLLNYSKSIEVIDVQKNSIIFHLN